MKIKGWAIVLVRMSMNVSAKEMMIQNWKRNRTAYNCAQKTSWDKMDDATSMYVTVNCMMT